MAPMRKPACFRTGLRPIPSTTGTTQVRNWIIMIGVANIFGPSGMASGRSRSRSIAAKNATLGMEQRLIVILHRNPKYISIQVGRSERNGQGVVQSEFATPVLYHYDKKRQIVPLSRNET